MDQEAKFFREASSKQPHRKGRHWEKSTPTPEVLAVAGSRKALVVFQYAKFDEDDFEDEVSWRVVEPYALCDGREEHLLVSYQRMPQEGWRHFKLSQMDRLRVVPDYSFAERRDITLGTGNIEDYHSAKALETKKTEKVRQADLSPEAQAFLDRHMEEWLDARDEAERASRRNMILLVLIVLGMLAFIVCLFAG